MNDFLEKYGPLTTALALIFLFTGILVLMIYGQAVIIPIIIAIAIWFIINDMTQAICRYKIAGRQIPPFIATPVVLLLITFAIATLARMIFSTAVDLVNQIPEYEENLEKLLATLPPSFWELIIDTGNNQVDIVYDVEQLFSSAASLFSAYVSTIAAQILNILFQAIVIFFYVIFLLLEEHTFRTKLVNMFPDRDKREQIQQILLSISTRTQRYVSVKTYVSFLTGLGSFALMWFFGLDYAVLWATLIFLLNYIPYVGSIVAVFLPVTLSLLQFGNFTTSIILLILLLTIQTAVGYVIEPMIMGNSLDISAFVVLASLSVFGTIWGVAGMILAIPIVIILIIVFSHFEFTQPIAVLLSGNGQPYKTALEDPNSADEELSPSPGISASFVE